MRAHVRASRSAGPSEAGVDYVIGETFGFFGEALVALDVSAQRACRRWSRSAASSEPMTRDGRGLAEACRRLADAGADVVGLNCIRGPATMLPLLDEIVDAVDVPVAALPVPYRTTEAEPTFQSLTDPQATPVPDGRAVPRRAGRR